MMVPKCLLVIFVHEFSLSTPFDISTATHVVTIEINEVVRTMQLPKICLCFVMQTIHAEIVKPVFKQLKDPNLDGANNEPSTTSDTNYSRWKKDVFNGSFRNRSY